MRYENSKSVILTILVMVSIVLTWNLWTYQPNYDTMENGNTVAEVTVREKQEVQKIIRPDQIIFHQKGQHYGSTNADQLDKVIRELDKWSFYDLKKYTGKTENIKELVHGDGKVEIIFPGEIPIELYRSVLNFEQKKIPIFNFNRIVIDVENSNKDNGIVYFISSNYQQVFMSDISTADLAEFSRTFYKNATSYSRYFAFEAADKHIIYLPDTETEMTVYKYLPVTLNSDEFKEALFSDPTFVQKSVISSVEEYKNAFSKMTVNSDTNILSYVNPTTDNNYYETSYELVKRSIDFVNEHGGWTNSYRFVSKDEVDHSVTFRLYTLDGYPVFNDRGISEINEVWGRDEINKYIRPNISLELPVTTEMEKITLPSGHDIIKFLQTKKNVKPELMDQITLGYQMKRDAVEQQLILLEPTWYYRYDKTWWPITQEDLGGLKHGLE